MISHLRELKNILQVEFTNGYLLDIDWRPSFKIDGQFKLALIKDFNLENSVYLGSAINLFELKKKLN